MLGRILLIEEDPEYSREISSRLAEALFEVTEVANCLMALMHLLDNGFSDLAIVDERLPLIDGWETAHLLRRAYGLPVVVIGESTGQETWTKVTEAGADFYLRMPMSSVVLVSRIKAILRRYQESSIMFPV